MAQLTGPDDQNPSLLIPLKGSPDFLLVFDTHVSLYKDVLSGVPQRIAVPIPEHILPPLHPGDSTHRPQWVQWDRPPRNPDFPKESFYVAREDGRVMYAEQGPAGAVDMDDAGEWPYRIDKAFACVSVDNSEFSQSYPDVLMAGAAGNDGLLCKVGAWPTEYSYATQYPVMNQFTFVESMPNWSPLTGLCVTKLPGIREPYERMRSALFVSNGTAPHGQISELRHGYHALIDGSFGGMKGCTGLWVLHHGSQMIELDGNMARQHYAFVVVSMPLETLLLRLIRTQSEGHGEFSGAWDDAVWDVNQLPTEDEPLEDGITRNQETVSACILSNRFSVQITRRDAQIIDRPALTLKDKLVFPTPILLAATKSGVPFVATTLRHDGRTHLSVIPVSNDGTFAKNDTARMTHVLNTDPTCIELLELNGRFHVLVGTLDSKISLFEVSLEYTLSMAFQSSLDVSPAGGSRTLCERAVVLTSSDDDVLVCATRDGLLLSCSLRDLKPNLSARSQAGMSQPNGGQGGTQASIWTVTRIGSTPAQLFPSTTDRAAAFVSCASDFCRICITTGKAAVLGVQSVWFANRTRPGYMQHPITAAFQLGHEEVTDGLSGRRLGGLLFVVSGDQMLYTHLDAVAGRSKDSSTVWSESQTKTLPRKLITGAKPTHAAYLTLPRKMLVATTEARESSAAPEAYRAIHSKLILLNLHDERPLDEIEVKEEMCVELNHGLAVAQYVLHHAERVYAITDWAYEDDRGKKYNLVIVGTGIRAGSGKETGRRLIFNLGQRGSRLSLQKESTYSHPVYCVAMFGRRATVSVIGNTLHFDEFDAALGR